VRSRLRALALVATFCLATAATVAGCGSGSSSSATAASASTPSTGPKESAGSAKPHESASGDQSIQQFGGAAKPDAQSAIEGAVQGFLTAMATRDYAGVCSGLTKTNREQLAAFGTEAGEGGCEAALKDLVSPGAAKEAQLAAAASITSIRVKGDTAFVLFTPRGGSESYLVMKREGGAWRSIAVTPGTPVAPGAGQ
jgi:hypothetical protein